MKTRKVLKIAAPIMVASLVFAPIASPISAYASENESIVSPKLESEATEILNSINIEQLQNQAKQMGTYDSEGNVTITDSKLVRLMQSQNIQIPVELKKAVIQRKADVTKVVRKNGYTTFYLSATTASAICGGSIAAAMFLTAITGGLGFQLAIIVVSTVSSMSWSYMKGGIWLKFKGLKLVSKGKQ
ncbi:hypothetical protein [Listeria sp. PSOL-1]|uniref:hypothetical protein n=1 Tax=Listeria sp. PSOL-1 TaxID=1844999 RepID=UPI0013D6759A|nr:hypothetical protein [Listeria sp. PSOL-1]